jgi:hypothetical protein
MMMKSEKNRTLKTVGCATQRRFSELRRGHPPVAFGLTAS